MNEKNYKEPAGRVFPSITDGINSAPPPRTLMSEFLLLFLLLPSRTILIAKSLFGSPMGQGRKEQQS